jgi:hypothetical protein
MIFHFHLQILIANSKDQYLVLSDEMKTCMRLLGAKTVEDLGPHLVGGTSSAKVNIHNLLIHF